MQVWQLNSEICHCGDGGLKLNGRSAVKIVVDGIEKPLADVIYKPNENTLYLVDEKEGDKCLKSLSVLKGYTMRTEQTNYSVYRSRNNGKFWGLISYGMNLDLEEAQSFYEKEQKRLYREIEAQDHIYDDNEENVEVERNKEVERIDQ